jgi:hypothetical protein
MTRKSSNVAPTHVLWVTTEKPCKGCTQIKQILNRYKSVKEVVLVQDIKNLRQEQVPLPDWLRGTPTLYKLSTRELFEGHAGIIKLQELLQTQENHVKDSNKQSQEPEDAKDSFSAAPIPESSVGSWEETPNEPAEDQFEMEVGCNPESISDTKVNMQDIEKIMQARGIEMSQPVEEPVK